VVNHHFRRYSRRRLDDILRTAGLQVSHVTYFNTWLFPAVASARLASRIRRSEGGSDLTLPSPAVNRLLTRIFASEARIVPTRALPFGVSLLAVARCPLHGAA
jgi:hypothetical protein